LYLNKNLSVKNKLMARAALKAKQWKLYEQKFIQKKEMK